MVNAMILSMIILLQPQQPPPRQRQPNEDVVEVSVLDWKLTPVEASAIQMVCRDETDSLMEDQKMLHVWVQPWDPTWVLGEDSVQALTFHDLGLNYFHSLMLMMYDFWGVALTRQVLKNVYHNRIHHLSSYIHRVDPLQQQTNRFDTLMPLLGEWG